MRARTTIVPFRPRSRGRRPSRKMRRGFVLVAAGIILGASFPFENPFRPGTDQMSLSSGARILAGPVHHVRDGDTIEVRGTAIRFAKLDCAERGTAQGEQATERMKALVRSVHLTCNLTGRKSYDRMIGTCRLPDGRDLGTVMITSGMCDRYR